MTCIRALIFCTFFVANLAQCVWFLDNTRGGDSQTCGEPNTPCLTLAYVLNYRINSSCEAYVISIYPGTFSGEGNEQVVFPQVNGSFSLQAVTVGTVTFHTDNSVSIISINKGNRVDVIFEGISFTRTVTVGPACVNYNSYGNLKFIDCEFINWQGNNPTVEINIDTITPTTIEFTRVKFVNCSATDTSTYPSAAIFVGTGSSQSPQYNQFVVTITNCIFNSNMAMGIGGAVQLEGVSSTISGSLFVNNTARLDGGALYVNGGSLQAYNNTFINNKASGSGGALYLNFIDRLSLYDSLVQNNAATLNGGGIYVSMTLNLNPGSKVNLWSLVVKQNQAQEGGGIWIASTVPEPGVIFFVIDRLLIESNSAFNGTGGGFFITNEGLVMISNSQIISNYANLGGGGGNCDGTTRVSGNDVTFSNNRANNTCLNDISGICFGFISSPCAQKQQQTGCQDCTNNICSIGDNKLAHCFASGADPNNPYCLCSSLLPPSPGSAPSPSAPSSPSTPSSPSPSAPSSPTSPENPPDNSRLGLIIGGSIAGVLVLIIIVAIIITRGRRTTEYEPLRE